MISLQIPGIRALKAGNRGFVGDPPLDMSLFNHFTPAAVLDQALDAVQDLPWITHAAMAMAFAAGGFLWLMGRRVLRPMSVVLLAAIGATAAFLSAPETGLGATLGDYGSAGAGLVAGAVLGLVMYRVALAVGLALVLAVAAPLATSLLLPPPSADGEPTPAVMTLRERYRESASRMEKLSVEAGIGRVVDPLPDDPPTTNGRPAAIRKAAGSAGRQIGTFVSVVRDEATHEWNSIPEQRRFMLTVVAVGGCVLGFLMGLALPAWAAGAVTAMLGAGSMVAAGTWLAGAMAIPGYEKLGDFSNLQWLTIWGVLSLLGVGIQWGGLGRGPGAHGTE